MDEATKITFTPAKQSPLTCDICGMDASERSYLFKYNEADIKAVEKYVEEHTTTHAGNKIKPIWLKCCSALKGYTVKINTSKFER